MIELVKLDLTIEYHPENLNQADDALFRIPRDLSNY